MCIRPISVKGRQVACGHCIECRMQYSSTWAFRIGLEAQQYESNVFITLTYNEDNRPEGDHLSKRDLQLFMKRLRKHFSNDKIRFFACGEYGSKKGRPHYHVILFNCNFDDLYYWTFDNKKNKLFRSPTLEKIWTKGFSSVAELTDESAKYCAKYLQKIPQDGRPRPFVLMSRRPGIGFNSINANWVLTDKMYLHGKALRLPRYFVDVLSRDMPSIKDIIKEKRDKNDISRFYVDNDGRFHDELYQGYVQTRIDKLSRNFSKNDVFDVDTFFRSKKLKNIVNSSIRDLKYNRNGILLRRYFEFSKNYKKTFEKLLTSTNPLIIIDNDLTMRKSSLLLRT